MYATYSSLLLTYNISASFSSLLDIGQPYCEENHILHKDVEQDETLLQIAINKVQAKVMTSPNLRKKCGNFDYNGFLDKAIRHFHDLVGQESGLLEKIFIIAGRTQAGKTSVKGVIQSLAGLLRIPLVILTKGVDESIDLHSKLVDLASGTLVEEKHIVVGELFVWYLSSCTWLYTYLNALLNYLFIGSIE